MQLIAFTGLKGSGKDTAAQVLIDRGFTHVKFADGLKGMLRHLLEGAGETPENAARMIDGDLKEVAHPALSGETPRWAMQTLGTDWARRCIHADFWVNLVAVRIASLDRVVISDARFPNEIAMVRAMGGLSWRVERGMKPTDLHESEAHIPTLDVDHVISNSFGSAAEFQQYVGATIHAW